ncbi:Bug family tripartite tricarboxylate transporter substrate binding protein [Cupriavidus alkaliphilus]|uniref:Tripartite-type tricarboxylate transporter receptor subunit TctC n=1 Tax=Cupriavidus alkaliphilus TaxID=942866 RepID=A0A7W4V916_9BURK|nr:tripartite tricarboxylate transporter substrate-binding protein [Cupriavidus alkaliphilus]MBB3007327.1 tripartite-type tricarboxylate transporter receptor subunit TctC [Cupriavidus alkaliphilus]
MIAGAMLGMLAPGAHAEAFPDKPIRLVVAFSAGGPTDIIARVIARDMGTRLGQQIIVDNRPGAGGDVAAEFVAKAPADGYTLLYNSSSIAISPALFNNTRLNPDQIFAPVA